MASSKSEKIEPFIYVLRELSRRLEILSIHGETQHKVHEALPRMDVDYTEKDVGDWTNADYEAYWSKTGLEIQEAINEIGALGVKKLGDRSRDVISIALVELEDFIVEYSSTTDAFCLSLPETGNFRDNLLRHIQSTVCDSTEPEDIEKLIRHLMVVRRRSKVRPPQNQTQPKIKDSLESEPQGKDGQGKKISKDEANIRARNLIKENPNITARELAKKIPCSTGLISSLPAWKALQEYKKKTFGMKKPKIVPLTKELEYMIGTEDEKLNQLIAEQEGEELEDARPAKLYLSHKKKPDQGRG